MNYIEAFTRRRTWRHLPPGERVPLAHAMVQPFRDGAPVDLTGFVFCHTAPCGVKVTVTYDQRFGDGPRQCRTCAAKVSL